MTVKLHTLRGLAHLCAEGRRQAGWLVPARDHSARL